MKQSPDFLKSRLCRIFVSIQKESTPKKLISLCYLMFSATAWSMRVKVYPFFTSDFMIFGNLL